MQAIEAHFEAASLGGPMTRDGLMTRDDYFHSFLADEPCYLVPARLLTAERSPGSGQPLIVNPNASFSWRDGVPASLQPWPERFLPNAGLISVYDPTTEMTTPFWAGPWFQGQLANLWPGEPAPPDLAHGLRDLLYSAGILIDQSAAALKGAEWAENVHGVAAQFADIGYAPIGQWAHPYHLGALRRYYRRLLRTGGMTLGDSGSPRRYVAHNDGVARYFHQQLTAMVSRIVGVPVKPSYVYVSSYQSGAELPAHTDREQCEYSITTLIDHTPEPAYQSPWPLYLRTHKGPVAIWQGLGEGLIYCGRELPHYRSRLPDGMSSTSIFFHYVDQDYAGQLD